MAKKDENEAAVKEVIDGAIYDALHRELTDHCRSVITVNDPEKIDHNSVLELMDPDRLIRVTQILKALSKYERK